LKVAEKHGLLRGRIVVSVGLAMLAGCGPSKAPQTGFRMAPPPAAPSYAVAVRVPPPAPVPPAAPAALVANLQQLVRQFNGRMGVAVESVDHGWLAQVNGGLSLPQQSVSKLWVAMTVLDAVDAGRLRLSDPVVVRLEDLTLFHQPIAALVKGDGYHTTIGELLHRALTMSDNTANDKLLHLAGGPDAVRAFLARKNLVEVHFGPGERLLQSATAGLTWKPEYSFGNAFELARMRLPMATRVAALDAYVASPPDGASPRAVAYGLARLARGDLLSPASTQYLLGTMGQSITGRARMRAVIPAGWSIAHKTGTGQDLGPRNAGFNDVGVLTAPDGKRYTIAVMIGDTLAPIRERQALIQAIAASVIANVPAPAVTVAEMPRSRG
jgi:beta-lactamase class A